MGSAPAAASRTAEICRTSGILLSRVHVKRDKGSMFLMLMLEDEEEVSEGVDSFV